MEKSNLTQSLSIQLIDGVSAPGKMVAKALRDAERQAKEFAKAASRAGISNGLANNLQRIGASAADIKAVGAAWKGYAASARLAGNATSWTRDQRTGVRAWERRTVSAIRNVKREQETFRRAQERVATTPSSAGLPAIAPVPGGGGKPATGKHGASADGGIGGFLALAAVHPAFHFGRESLRTYREFDKESRATQAFGHFSNEEMAGIVKMAIHGGASTKYNDIQWLEGSKELGARGVKAAQVKGILPEAANLGQAMDITLPAAVKLLEGALFGFSRDVGTFEKATAAARRSADLQTAAAKASGMKSEDIEALYKYGAPSANLSKLGEERMLAFGALGKKVNIGGDEMGVAFRAMATRYLMPTRKGREALASVGVNLSEFQRMPERLSVDNYAGLMAQQYGVKLNGAARGKLESIFTDKSKFGSATEFATAISGVMKDELGIKNGNDRKKFVGASERFRQNNISEVDTKGLMDALMKQLQGGNLGLATSIFGEKQASRVMMAMRDQKLWDEMLTKIEGVAEGNAGNISRDRMGGFDGAVSRFEGAVKNLETALPRAFDSDGKGGVFTAGMNIAGGAVQGIAEAPGAFQRLITEAGALGTVLASIKASSFVAEMFGAAGFAARLGVVNGVLTKLGLVGITAAAALEVVSTLNKDLADNGRTYEEHHKATIANLDRMNGALQPNANPVTPKMRATLNGEQAGGGLWSWLFGSADDAKSKATETGEAIKSALSVTARPEVETGALDVALGKARELKALLGSLGSMTQHSSTSLSGALGKTMRGNFTAAGVQGE